MYGCSVAFFDVQISRPPSRSRHTHQIAKIARDELIVFPPGFHIKKVFVIERPVYIKCILTNKNVLKNKNK